MYQYETKKKISSVQESGIEPAGIVIESIELQSKLFGNWAPASVPMQTVRDELAKVIADELLLDVEWSKDPRSGHSTARVSSAVYMKPSLQDLLQISNDLRGELASVRGKALSDQKQAFINLTKCQNKSEEYMLKYLKYQGLYLEYLGNDNSWEYLIKRGFRLMWLNFKCEIYQLARFIPFRG